MDGRQESPGRHALGKLLPKSMSRRKRSRHGSTPTLLDDGAFSGRPSSLFESDGTTSSCVPSDDDRSLGPYDASPDDSAGALRETDVAVRHEPLAAPARPLPVSPHPSMVGYLTTSSPEVLETVVDTQTPPPPTSAELAPLGRGPASSSFAHQPSDVRRSTSAAPVRRERPASARLAKPSRPSPALPSVATSSPQPLAKAGEPAPVIVNTPPTPTEALYSAPPESRLPQQDSTSAAGAYGTQDAQNMSARHRSKSGSAVVRPSTLSTTTKAPATPTDEGIDQPPSSAASPSGFFSSVISAAQSAANTLSSNIQNSSISNLAGNKSRSSLTRSDHSRTSSVQPDTEIARPDPPVGMDQKESAVRTLGDGDLSLSQLGFPDQASTVGSPASNKFGDVSESRARSESAPADTVNSSGEFIPEDSASRPRSLYESGAHDDGQHGAPFENDNNRAVVHRDTSVRSSTKHGRKRESSVATGGSGTTIGAAIAAANNSVANPAGMGFGAPKLTGFAIASKKRNRDFHSLFKSVPDDDYLIEDYSCALQREILAHGRLYVSEGHLCFSSNILGWMTTLVMSFDEIVSVEKRSTALLFKNGLMISTLHAKHIFASFTSRDATYDLIVNIWKLGHPTLKSTLNGVRLEGTGGDRTENVDAERIVLEDELQAGSESEDETDQLSEDGDEDFYEEDQDKMPDTQMTDVTMPEGDGNIVARKASGLTVIQSTAENACKETIAASTASVDFPGPPTHAPTDCGDSATHYEKHLVLEVIPAPLGKVYNLVFGPASTSFMSKFLTTDQRCTELQMDDKKGLTEENRQRTYTFIKPLNGSIGPKQTKCINSETLEHLDFDKAANFSVATQTPDVPNGNAFTVKTKYCLSWAQNNSTQFQASCTIEWSSKSWLKGPIEKGAQEGQIQYCKDLCGALKTAVSARPPFSAVNGGLKTRAKKARKKSNGQSLSEDAMQEGTATKGTTQQSWGLLEPARSLVEPVFDVVRPILTGNVMYGLLVGLLVATWFGFGFAPRKATTSFGSPGFSPYRFSAYEEMWQREDGELWAWLEERVGLERLGSDAHPAPKQRIQARTLEEKLRQERRSEKEMERAVEITEEKLKVLKEVMARSGAGRERNGAPITHSP